MSAFGWAMRVVFRSFAAVTLLFYFFLVMLVLQVLYTGWYLWTAAKTAPAPADGPCPPVSVLVCARDEAAGLAANLPLLLAQAYPDFEVIVVDDASADGSAELLRDLAAQYPQLRVISPPPGIPRVLPGKKHALQQAVAAARNELLLLTDADCRPASAQWLALMIAPLRQGKELVAGYGAASPGRGLLPAFVQWETLHTMIQYSSYAYSGIPYMATGRNLACRKALLQRAAADPLWASMPSGDDDLLIQLTATGRNMGLVIRPEAFTFSPPKRSWRDWLVQKQRHVSTGKIYRPLHRVLLGLYGLSHGLMWLLFLVLAACGRLELVAGIMLLRCLLTWLVWSIAALQTREYRLILYFPLFDLGWALYNFVLSPFILFKNKQRWK